MKKQPKTRSSLLNMAYMRRVEMMHFTKNLAKAHTNETLKAMGISIKPKK